MVYHQVRDFHKLVALRSSVQQYRRDSNSFATAIVVWGQDAKNLCGDLFAALKGLTSCHLKKTWKSIKEKNRASIGHFENRAQMDSARSAASLQGIVLEVLRTGAGYQCSTLLTMRVLAVLPLILCVLKYVGVHYYCG